MARKLSERAEKDENDKWFLAGSKRPKKKPRSLKKNKKSIKKKAHSPKRRRTRKSPRQIDNRAKWPHTTGWNRRRSAFIFIMAGEHRSRLLSWMAHSVALKSLFRTAIPFERLLFAEVLDRTDKELSARGDQRVKPRRDKQRT